MKSTNTKMSVAVCLFSVFGMFSTSFAQLNTAFETLFNGFLSPEVLTLGSGVFHGNHYLEAAELAANDLSVGLNSLITNNIAAFPLSSTSAGGGFDFSTGLPVPVSESLGPIFAETAKTLGKGKANFGFNYTHLNFSHLRGMPLEDLRFTFFHQDVDPAPDLGNPAYELDTIDLFPDIHLTADIFAFFATVGITNTLDMGLAVPIIRNSLHGTARATINSFSYGRILPNTPQFEGAAHRFGGPPESPILNKSFEYGPNAGTISETEATGVGDIALRLKFSFVRSPGLDMAALLDVRLPTGDEKNFLGTGETGVNVSWIISRKTGDFTPHLNVSYDRRPADFDSDKIKMIAGFDQKLATNISFAVDFFANINMNDSERISLFPGTVTLKEEFNGGTAERIVDKSNVPEDNTDNTYDASFGFRINPIENMVFLGNLFVPLNDGGLRPNITPTFGVAILF